MRASIVCTLGVVLALFLCYLTPAAEAHDLVKSYEGAPQDTGVTFVMFYAPWCGHCKRLTPTWMDLFNLKLKGLAVRMHDCDADQALCVEAGVRGYPTLKVYVDGKFSADYREARDLNSILRFLKREYGDHIQGIEVEDPEPEPEPVLREEYENGVLVLQPANVEERITEEGLFVKFYAPWCGHCKRMAGDWETLAAAHPDRIAQVNCDMDKPLCTKYGVRGYPTLLFLRKGQEAVPYTSARSLEAFDAFFEKQYAE